MKKFMRGVVTLLIIASLLWTLPIAGSAKAGGDDADPVSGGARSLSEQWFSDQPVLSEESRGFLRDLYIYFKHREADFSAEKNGASGSGVLKDGAVSHTEKARTEAVARLCLDGGLEILDAAVSVIIQGCSDEGGLIYVTAYEWTFFDYDDLSDDTVTADVSGFGTLHQLTLAPDGATYRIVGDVYDESDISGISTVKSETQPLVLSPAPQGSAQGFCPGYDPDAAARYADGHVWNGADMSVSGVFESYYNPEYYNFNSVGGDCANYVSQCLYAGGLPQTAGAHSGYDCWYFDTENNRADTWTRATILRRWLAGHYGRIVDNPTDSDILTGSPVFYSKSGGAVWNHATICVGVNSAGTPIVNSHNNDRYHVVWNYWPAGTTISTVQLTAKAENPAAKTDGLSMSLYGYPTALVTGVGFTVYGTVSSESSRLRSVEVGVYDMSGNIILGGAFEPNACTAALDTLDAEIRLGTLTPGWYHYKVTASNVTQTATLADRIFLVNDGKGTADEPYLVDSPAMLSGLAEAVNSGCDFAGKTFRLISDISLDGTNWNPIGTEKSPFRGSFDGYGHTVSGLVEVGSTLFGVTKDAVISNLAVDGCLAAANGGKLINCMTTGSALAAVNTGSVTNCWSPEVGAGAAPQLNAFVTSVNDAGLYFLWKQGGEHPEFDPLSVTFTVTDGSGEHSATVSGLPYGGLATAPDLDLPDGAAVSGWYQDPGFILSRDDAAPVTSSITLYAALKTESYSLALDSAGGAGVAQPGTVHYGQAVSLPMPLRDGYTFTGWHTASSGGTKADWTVVPDLGADGRKVTLYAGWTANSYAITLNAPGAENAYNAAVSATYGSKTLAAAALPVRVDAGFAGYYAPDGQMVIDIYGQFVPGAAPYTDDKGSWALTGGAALDARWNENHYTVTYYSGYGRLDGLTVKTENRIYTAVYGMGESVALPIPERVGYTFRGWYGSGDFSGRRLRALEARENTVLYARWMADNLTWTDAFPDVRLGDWYYEAAKYVSQNGIMTGGSAGSFDPLSGMTRGMLVTVLWRLEGSPAPLAQATYEDVEDGLWYSDAIVWATESGIATGGDGNCFAPDGVLTRQEIATFLYRYARYAGVTTTLNTALALGSFTDAGEVSEYAVEPMLWAVQVGLMLGTADGTLSPEQPATRAAAAALLMRFDRLG